MNNGHVLDGGAKGKSRKKMFKKKHCSPGKLKINSCLNDNLIIKIAMI